MLATFDIFRLNALAHELWQWIGHALLFGSALALLTWLVLKTVGRRARPALHAALWLIVLIKFVVPFGPASAFSLASTLHKLEHYWPSRAPAPVTTTAGVDHAPQVMTLMMLDAATGSVPLVSAPERSWQVFTWLALGYVAAVLVMGLIRLRSYWCFASMCRQLASPEEWIGHLVREVCNRMRIRRVPDVRVSEDAPAPFILGVWHPMLILSRRQLVRPDELEAVVLHEVAHLRRRDLFVRYLQWLAGTLLFFWPVVAWVNRRIDLARECACDEWALRHGSLSAGEYARCLLNALQPARSRWRAYRPAAMAANLAAVERRIEMIMQTPRRRNQFGPLGLPMVLLTLAWGGFALSGAARAYCPPEDGDGDANVEAQDEIVFFAEPLSEGDQDIFHVEVEATEAVPAIMGLTDADEPVALPLPPLGEGRAKVIVRRRMAAGGTPPFNVKFGIHSDEKLAEFLATHPTADADGDGQLTPNEHDAYLVALAMSRPADVLKQFPFADRDKNGALEPYEAVQLVTGGIMFRIESAAPATAANGEGGTLVRKEVRAMALRAEGEDAPPRRPFGPRRAAETARWLENIQTVPTAAVVAAYVTAIEEAPNAALLAEHPDADTNGDGTLSTEEREAFFKQMEAKVAKRMFVKFPEADTNGDGAVTPDEMAEYHMSRAEVGEGPEGEGVRKVIIRRKAEGDEGETEDVIIEKP